MTKEAAARIVDGLNTTQRISLRIMVEETRLGSFAAGAAVVLGSNFRDLFASVNGAAMTDCEIRRAVYRVLGS